MSQQFQEELEELRHVVRQQQAQIALLLESQTKASSSNVKVSVPANNFIQEPKMAPPEFFTGDRKKSRNFMLQITNIFNAQPSRYPNDEIKIAYIISFFRETAMEWIAPIMMSKTSKSPDPYHLAILSDARKFSEAFLLMFDDSENGSKAETKLMTMKQGNRPVSALIAEFQRLCVDAGWSGDSLFRIFYNMLNEDVKDELSKKPRPKTLQEYFEDAARIDTRLFERKMERKSLAVKSNLNSKPQSFMQSPPPQTSFNGLSSRKQDDPMVLDSVSVKRGPLTDFEKKRRMDLGLCLYCGAKDHKISNCPKRSMKTFPAINSLEMTEDATSKKQGNANVQA